MEQKEDTPSNTIANVKDDLEYHPSLTPEQKEFYLSIYSNVSSVKTERLHCTSCDVHLGSNTLGNIFVHPLLQVLLCGPCLSFYNSGEFQKGDDGSELHCRWCGQGGQVYCCSKCPTVFCKPCIKRNFSKATIKMIDDSDEWSCFLCDSKPMWMIQARCWALSNFLRLEKRACENLDADDYRKQQSFIDHTLCCKTRSSLDKMDQLVSNSKLRKRGSSVLKADKSLNMENEVAPKRLKSVLTTNVGFKMDAEEEHEVVCTPDIFACFGDNPDDPDVPEEVLESPSIAVNGSNENNANKPRISVRPPESLMQSPDQPMFQAHARNRLLLCSMPGPSGVASTARNMYLNPANTAIKKGNQKLLAPKQSNFSKLRYKLLHLTQPPPLSPLIQINSTTGNISQSNFSNVNQANTFLSPSAQSNQGGMKHVLDTHTTKIYTNRGNKSINSINITDIGAKNKSTNEQTLSTLLQKKIKENPKINDIKLQRLPEWFHTNTQSCLVIAYNFVSQLLDLQTKANKVRGCSYDEVKNMHVQLSFFISALIGKLKSNQSDLNSQLSEWTDTLCKSLDEPVTEVLVQKPAKPIQRTKLYASTISMQCREEHKDLFKKFESDRKLNMDAIVSVAKFKFHKSTNVFKVKPKVRQIIKTPSIDPNVIQTIDSDSDDDDCCILPDPEPALIDLVSEDQSNSEQELLGQNKNRSISEGASSTGHAEKESDVPISNINVPQEINERPSDVVYDVTHNKNLPENLEKSDDTIQNESVNEEKNHNALNNIRDETNTDVLNDNETNEQISSENETNDEKNEFDKNDASHDSNDNADCLNIEERCKEQVNFNKVDTETNDKKNNQYNNVFNNLDPTTFKDNEIHVGEKLNTECGIEDVNNKHSELADAAEQPLKNIEHVEQCESILKACPANTNLNQSDDLSGKVENNT